MYNLEVLTLTGRSLPFLSSPLSCCLGTSLVAEDGAAILDHKGNPHAKEGRAKKRLDKWQVCNLYQLYLQIAIAQLYFSTFMILLASCGLYICHFSWQTTSFLWTRTKSYFFLYSSHCLVVYLVCDRYTVEWMSKWTNESMNDLLSRSTC